MRRRDSTAGVCASDNSNGAGHRRHTPARRQDRSAAEFDTFKPEAHVGHRMEARGLMLAATSSRRLKTTAYQVATRTHWEEDARMNRFARFPLDRKSAWPTLYFVGAKRFSSSVQFWTTTICGAAWLAGCLTIRNRLPSVDTS